MSPHFLTLQNLLQVSHLQRPMANNVKFKYVEQCV